MRCCSKLRLYGPVFRLLEVPPEVRLLCSGVGFCLGGSKVSCSEILARRDREETLGPGR